MALFTKILIVALCAIAVECTMPLLRGSIGVGNMDLGMGLGTMGRFPGMMGMGGMYPGMMGMGGMFPGMMGYKEGEEKSGNPSGSSTLDRDQIPVSKNDDPTAWELSKAVDELAEKLRKDQPEPMTPH